jgi:transcription antitermination factor NusG
VEKRQKTDKSASPVKAWRAIYVKSRAEKKVGNALLERKIEAYVPVSKTLRQWSDRKKLVELPILSGYVFVHVDTSETEKVIQTGGVVNFVKSGGKLALVRDEEIARLRQLIELGYQVEAGRVAREYREGDKVKITSGPLQGIEGYVTGGSEQKHFEILLESIGQCIRARLPEGILMPSK